MRHTSASSRPRPLPTPRALKILILLTIGIALCAALFDALFHRYGLWSPQDLLALSTTGIDRLFLWQLVTYLFVGSTTDGITFSMLLHLLFNSYLLWIIGTTFIERKGRGHFFFLYLMSGACAGAAIYALQHALGNPVPFTGNLTSTYALLLAWTALYPQAQMLLFFAIPMKAKNLIWVLVGVTLLIELSEARWSAAVGYAAAALVGYLYGRCLASLTARRRPFQTKIYDFRTGQPLPKDEEFLEAMLTKIALQGKESLTFWERWKLKRISKKREKKG